jgi:hypothetical protein
MSEVTITKIRRQLIEIEFTQSPNVVITTLGVEIVVAPNTNIVRNGVLIGSTTNLGGVSVRRNLSRNSTLSTSTIKVVGTP